MADALRAAMHRTQQTSPFTCSISLRPKLGAGPALMPPVFSTIRPTTINGKDDNMTYEQSLDLAELQADMAFETYLSAFEDGDRPEVIDSLATEAPSSL